VLSETSLDFLKKTSCPVRALARPGFFVETKFMNGWQVIAGLCSAIRVIRRTHAAEDELDRVLSFRQLRIAGNCINLRAAAFERGLVDRDRGKGDAENPIGQLRYASAREKSLGIEAMNFEVKA
jgi:hypothetical protein